MDHIMILASATFSRLSQWISDRLTRAADFLFGFDFFISYAHADGTQYSRMLRDRLEGLGYRVFLDVHGFAGGDDLRTGTRRRIRMSKKLILLAGRHALSKSPWVQLELEHFIALRRSPIVIEFPNTEGIVRQGSPLAILLFNRVSIREKLADADGIPSEAVIQDLVRSFDATRQETIRLRALGGTALVFILIAGLAIWQWYEAVQERRVAQSQESDAKAAGNFIEAGRIMAEWDLDSTRRSALQAEIDRLRTIRDNKERAKAALRLSNLGTELADTEASLTTLAEQARSVRNGGYEELDRADKAWSTVARDRLRVRQRPPVPKIFSIEVLSVGSGDSLILHYGPPDAPRFIIIDGGPSSTFEKTLKPRLEALRQRWTPGGRLPIEYVMVSSQYDSRRRGLESMFRNILAERNSGVEPAIEIKNVWFNSFAPPYPRWGPATTRQYIDQLAIPLNRPFDHLVMLPETGSATVEFDEGLTATVLGPNLSDVSALHDEWVEVAKGRSMEPPPLPIESFSAIGTANKHLPSAGAKLSSRASSSSISAVPPDHDASCEGLSATNRGSLIILFEFAGKSFLHPGDSCWTQVEAGLRQAGLTKSDGSFYVDIMLVPRFGSHLNVSAGFFKRVTARQYLFTTDGKNGMPNDATLQMILDARRGQAATSERYTFQFVNRDGTADLGERLDEFFATRSSQEYGYRRIFRSLAQNAIIIDLLERVRY